MEFPDTVLEDEMSMRTKEWLLLGYNIGLLHDAVLVGKREKWESGTVSWGQSAFYMLGKDGWFHKSCAGPDGSVRMHTIDTIEDLGTWR